MRLDGDCLFAIDDMKLSVSQKLRMTPGQGFGGQIRIRMSKQLFHVDRAFYFAAAFSFLPV